MFSKTKNIILPLVFIFCFAFFLILPEKESDNKPKGEILAEVGIKQLFPSGIDYGNSPKDLVVDKDTVISSGEHQYKSVQIKKGRLTLDKRDFGNPIIIKAAKNITIEEGAVIDLTGAGSRGAIAGSGAGGPVPGTDYPLGGGGGGSLTRGGNADCLAENEITAGLSVDKVTIDWSGSGGGASPDDITSEGGYSGGVLYLISPEINIRGSVLADGTDGKSSGGGGSGGIIGLFTDKLFRDGIISLKGGAGATGFVQGGGGGSGGILITNSFSNTPEDDRINLSGGTYGKSLDLYSGCDGTKGQNGIILRTK